MPKFLIREMQHVIAARVVDADNEKAAIVAFLDGEGEPAANDGDVTSSEITWIEELKPKDSDA